MRACDEMFCRVWNEMAVYLFFNVTGGMGQTAFRAHRLSACTGVALKFDFIQSVCEMWIEIGLPCHIFITSDCVVVESWWHIFYIAGAQWK